ncbi:hypothetical protein LUZ63_016605 [Rhynchospora breviuscula]|uniref:Uncharacterized protein n=1 Tax=Rhynchospora breviuscula TaxID=2022672 RepID=A0A9Q0C0H5_9POAL|nr:hypothetical protein LUZ63_016605 [Rhynchospora breviuscula]
MSLQNLHCLFKLVLHKILTITSLPPEEVLGALKNLQSIEIVDCYLLTSFGGISALTSLKMLNIYGSCLELQVSSDRSLLLSQLEELTFQECANIDVIIEHSDLPELCTLYYRNCSINKINLTNLLKLTNFTIEGCSQPFVLEGLSSLGGLDYLWVWKCPKVYLSSPEDKYASLLYCLVIDDLSLLTLMLSDKTISELEKLVILSVGGGAINGEVFKCLTSLKYLGFGACQITSLPTTMKGLANLHTLLLDDCKKLDNLNFLPENLKKLEIEDCPILEKQYGNGGRKYKKIAHIPIILFKW